MDGNLSEMLQGVLKDPAAMEKLMGVARNLMGETPPQEDPAPAEAPAASPPQEESRGPSLPTLAASLQAGNAERIALIRALRPYLSPERRQTADSLVRMLGMLKLADLNKLFTE